MSLYQIDPIQDIRWTRFTEIHPLATVFHSAPWLEALKRTYGYQASAFTTSPVTEPIANGLVFCQVSSWLTGRRLVSLPFSDHCDVLTTSAEEKHYLLSALIEHLDKTGAKYAEIRPLAPAISDPEFNGIQKFFLHKMDLRHSAEDLFQSFHKDSVQRKIRRAERERLDLEEGRSKPLLESFYRLLLITRQRHGVPPPPRKWFQNLVECLGNQLTVRVAYKDRNAIAAILTLRFKDTLVYKYGASDPRFHALGGMHALIWRAIQRAKQEGLQQLDMGRSDTDNPGLVTFKDRWGGARTKISYYRYALRPSQTAGSTAWSRRIVRQLIERMPGGVLSAAGKLLYRHVG